MTSRFRRQEEKGLSSSQTWNILSLKKLIKIIWNISFFDWFLCRKLSIYVVMAFCWYFLAIFDARVLIYHHKTIEPFPGTSELHFEGARVQLITDISYYLVFLGYSGIRTNAFSILLQTFWNCSEMCSKVITIP